MGGKAGAWSDDLDEYLRRLHLPAYQSLTPEAWFELAERAGQLVAEVREFDRKARGAKLEGSTLVGTYVRQRDIVQ